MVRLIVILVQLAMVVATVGAADVDFNRDVRPILADKCFPCHGPDAGARQADLRLDTKDGIKRATDKQHELKTSELVARVTSRDRDREMPPPDSGIELSDRQRSILVDWVSEGAKWSRHWAFVIPERPSVPKVSDEKWIRNPIDNFVLARLEREGLRPTKRADPLVLTRRLYFDLTGLPPKQNDLGICQTETVQQTTDRLMRSPSYGERMAIRWLEAARYADTNGYQTDGWRDMWRWRDWVIEAFNSNQPFDEFTIEQLAGDLLPSPTLAQLTATGFNRNHRGNSEGGIVPEEFQVEYVVDRVDTTFAVWQGLTLGCARCHDHKYDPLTQEDYYSVFAAFNRLAEQGRVWKEGNAEPLIKSPTEAQQRQLQSLRKTETTAFQSFDRHASPDPEELRPLSASMANDWTITDGLVLRQHGTGAAGDVADFGYFDRFSLGGWVFIEPGDSGTVMSRMLPVDQGGGYNLHVTPEGHVQANFVKRWLDDSVRVESKSPLPHGWSHVFVTYAGTRRARDIEIHVNGKRVAHQANHDFLNQSFAVDEPFRIGGGMSDFTGSIVDVHVYARVLTPSEIETLAASRYDGTEQHQPIATPSLWDTRLQQYYLLASGPAEVRRDYRVWIEAKGAADSFESTIPTVMVMRDQMSDRRSHVLKRGKYDQPGEAVNVSVPAALQPAENQEIEDRLGIARWLVSDQNPLTARVIVNRLWRDLFGVGLVKTTEDFGVQGERPSHPRLLDWLAVEFIESGWDIQHMLRLIVCSSTYQQSSRCSPEMHQRDPENRLFTHGPRFRLPAEMIRDQALSASGLLTNQLGGPSVRPYQPSDLWKDIASDTDYQQSSGSDLYRRSLYTYWKRTVPPAFMVNFDATGREVCDVAVRRTNTPLQALNLMNDVTFVEAARVMAQNALSLSNDRRTVLESIFLRTLFRQPNPTEQAILLESQATYSANFRRDPQAAKSLINVGQWPLDESAAPHELAAWTLVCNTLLNLDETVTKE